MLAPAFHHKTLPIPVIKTIASQKTGIDELLQAILTIIEKHKNSEKRSLLLAEKAFHLIEQKKMEGISKAMLKEKFEALGNDINLYQFIKQYL